MSEVTTERKAVLKPKHQTITVGDYTGPAPERPPHVHRVIPERKAALSMPRGTEPTGEAPRDPEIDAFIKEFADDAPEANAEPEAAKAEEPAGDDIDIDAIKARFKKEDPKALADVLAKSYGNAEKAMRQAQAERDMLRDLLKNGGQPGQSTTASAQPQQPPVIVPKVEVKPWDKDGFSKTFLDDIGGNMDQFRQHVLGEAQAWTKAVVLPMYMELIENKVHRKYPGVVTDESLPMIRALAQQQAEGTDLDKMMKAAEIYKTTFGQHLAKGTSEDVQKMKDAAAQPGPTAKVNGSGKIYTKAWIHEKLKSLRPGSKEYVEFAKKVQQAYDQKRVR